MAQHKSAEKRARQAIPKTARNAQWKTRMRNSIKTKAKAELTKTVKLLDQLAAKGVIHKNMASNQKSRLTRIVNALK
jgi:small subunit ribosomal protein S20